MSLFSYLTSVGLLKGVRWSRATYAVWQNITQGLSFNDVSVHEIKNHISKVTSVSPWIVNVNKKEVQWFDCYCICVGHPNPRRYKLNQQDTDNHISIVNLHTLQSTHHKQTASKWNTGPQDHNTMCLHRLQMTLAYICNHNISLVQVLLAHSNKHT
jgi:hypothetical protein